MQNCRTIPVSNLNYFLDFALWREAKKLLDFQIKQIDKNQHYNTLSLLYYKRIFSRATTLETENYFNQRVANNFFYGLQREFAVYDYVIPKSHLRLRSHKFFTYPMRVLYYSIGLYLLKLSEDFLNGYIHNNERIKCYYGGNLRFNKDCLVIKHETTFYKQYYKDFKKLIRKETNTSTNNKIVLKLDIQNYFDNISVALLLERIDRFVKPSIKEQFHFDVFSQEQIKFYFNYVSSNKGGIPQADNDIISGFIGNLYLIFSDLFIDEQLGKQKCIEKHQIIRYLDDIYIVINFDTKTDQHKKEAITDEVISQVSDTLNYRFELRLNTKTRIYWLCKAEHREELLKDLKKVSPDYYSTDDSDETPENKIVNIFDELEKLKKSGIDLSLCSDGSLQEEILKEVYDKSVNQLLEKKENQNKIEELFKDFNFDLVKTMPTEIIIIISKNQKTSTLFFEFLKRKRDLTTRDLYLIIKYLCQTNFQNPSLFKKLKNHAGFQDIASLYEKAKISLDFPGYYNLSNKQASVLLEKTHILEQIRLRVFNEKICSYSVALNHLLNEIHAICMLLDVNEKNKEYEADDAVRYLASQCISHENCIDIRNLFDRRNRNTVSHPGTDQKIAWGVTKNEYVKYRDAVGECLKIILPK